NEVAQDLGGHDHDRRAVVDRVFAGYEADRLLAVGADEVVELLVAERLEGRRVQDLGPVHQRPEDGLLGDDRLAARGGGADENSAAPAFELVDRLALEGVQLERERLLELVDERFDRLHNLTRSVDTSVLWAPSAWASMKARAASRTRSACRPSPLTVRMAISASCQRSSSPTSAAATFNSERRRRNNPLRTRRVRFRAPGSGRCRRTRATARVTPRLNRRA